MAFDWNSYQQDPTMAGGPSISGPTGPYGTQPGSQNTGINGGNLGGSVTPTSTSTATGDPAAYFKSKYPAGSNLSPQMLLADEADLKAHGITLIKNAAGQPGKIQLPDGSAYDVIQGAGAGQNIAQFNPIAGPGGAPIGGNGSTLGSLGYSFGSSMAPFTGTFAAPTAEEAINSPGLQFGLEEANRMMQNSAAAKGTLLNGRFQQALAASNIGNALQGYNDVYNRALNTFNTNRDIFYQNQDRPFNKSLSLAQLGKPT